MKQLGKVLWILFLPLMLNAQHGSRLKVWLDPISEQMMQAAGFEMDHGIVKQGVFLISDFSAEERAWLDDHSIRYEVEIEDVSHYYSTRVATTADRGSRVDCASGNAAEYPTPDNFELGSMGGFFTYDEFIDHLDNMVSEFPNLITAKAPIDTFLSHEDRPIYWLKISDNPGMDENEPEVLYTSIHHAREPESLSQLIFFMYYLLENYGSDPEVTHLVDETEMYFIPMINPDGYVRNHTTNPNGGGLWRKNMRDNGNGTTGVDLNRNYGFSWGLDNTGSSPMSSSETYRGTAAFSEPETQAVKWLCEQHNFKIALNYHSFGNYLIYPWGFQQSPLSPDSNEFIAFASEMTAQNNYLFGTGFQTVGYFTNGDSDDWMYGEQTSKAKILAMTPEVGSQDDGFWPAQSRIIPLAEENVLPNLVTAHLVGNYLSLEDLSPQYLSSTSGSLNLEVTRLGLEYTGTNSIELVAVSNVASTGPLQSLPAMTHLGTEDVTFSYDLSPGVQAGDLIEFDAILTMGGYSKTIRIQKTFGTPTLALNDNASGMDDFQSGTSWSTTDEAFVSPSTSITDSPYSNYNSNGSSVLSYSRIIDLRSAHSASMNFQAQWAIEDGWDYCQMQASSVDADAWQPLCGLYTETGNSNQDEGEPLWDGLQESWVTEQIDLSDYIGQRIKVRWVLVSDQFVELDGFYIDDLQFNVLVDESSGIPLDTGYIDTLGTGGGDTVDVTGIAELNQLVKIYPNPAHDVLRIDNESGAPVQLELYSLSGQLIRSWNVSLGQTAANLDGIASGSYLVRIESARSVGFERLVIQH